MADFIIRIATERDIVALKALKGKISMEHGYGYFERCFDEAAHGKRILVLAESTKDKSILGYGQLIWLPIYAPFRKFKIPEIQDLNVIADARRQGIGSALIDYCEAEVKSKDYADIGIGVGIISRFGNAQRLYVQKGYVPDGMGACYDDEMLEDNAIKPIDDLLSIKLVKKL